MSATEPEESQEPEQDLAPENNSEAESDAKEKSQNKPTVEGDDDWDGEDRRSEDRPWSDSDKENKVDGEVLSEEERDALSGEVEQLTDELGVATYDFYSPAHINKSSFPALAVINEKLIELMTEGLTNLLQREVIVATGDVDITRYGDFIHSLPVLVDTSIVNVSKIDAQSLVCIDGALIEIVMDSYFGGEGKLSDANGKQEFTDTEFNLSNKILEMFLISNKSAWEKTEPLDFEFIQRESQPKLINLIEESQLVVVCQFKVSLDEEASYIRIAYPYKGLDSIKKSLRSMVTERDENDDGQWRMKFFNSIKAAPIELNTILAEFNLTVDEVVKLKTGDVIPFSMPEEVTVYSSSTPIFTGKIGSVNDAVAISINSWIREQ